jgi:mannan endo-1,4-beta-mannosidase
MSCITRTKLRPSRRTACLLGTALALAAFDAHADLKIVNGVLQESNGQPFVMRGANVAHAWYRDKTAQSLSDLSSRGANTVRLVLSNGVKWTRTDESEVSGLISQAKAAKMIAVLEIHDTTGYGEQSGMSTLDQAADYWVSIKNALIGQEDYVIVNIGNEPLGNNQPTSAWVDGHKNAIAKIRAAGVKNTLMVDGANWGQDWQSIMRGNAASVFASDPLKNTLFSIHMYSVYPTDSAVNDYLSAFLSAKLPIVVGEFGNSFQGQTVAASAIMSRAVQYGIGYLGWSWSGNGGSDAPLDLVYNFDGNSLSPWGNLLFNDANGVTATAKRASIFGGSTGTTLPGAPSVTAAAGDGKVTLSWSAVSGVSTYEVARATSANGSFGTLATGLTATAYTDSGLSNGTTYYYTVSARNSAGATASAAVTATPKATTVVPSMPNVVATAGDGSVTLSWSAQSNVTSYAIARSQSQSGGYASVTTLSGDATSYTDRGLANGNAYYYQVTASNAAGAAPVASVVATPHASGGNAACTLTVDGSGDWGTGQVLRVILANTGTTALDGWSVSVTESSDFTIDSTWNATFAKSGRTMLVTPVDWSRTIWPGSHVEAGLQMSYSGARPVPTAANVAGLNCVITLK